MPGSISASLLAANQRPGILATFPVTDAPDVRITARSARLHGDAAFLGESVAAVALRGRRIATLRLLGAAATAGIARATLTLLAVADAGPGRRRWVEEARPSLGRRWWPFTARAPTCGHPGPQHGRSPSSAGDERGCHVAMIPARHARRWVRVSENGRADAKMAVPRPNGRRAQTGPRAAGRVRTPRARCFGTVARTCAPGPAP
jgi:hypothetical protein